MQSHQQLSYAFECLITSLLILPSITPIKIFPIKWSYIADCDERDKDSNAEGNSTPPVDSPSSTNIGTNTLQKELEPSTSTNKSETTTHYEKRYLPAWETKFTWLSFDGKAMKCSLCSKHAQTNQFTQQGSTNFRITTLQRHAKAHEHLVTKELAAEALAKGFEIQLKSSEEAAIVAIKAAHWLAKEEIATRKFDSLIELLTVLETPHVEKLQEKSYTYRSDDSCIEFQNAIAAVISQTIDEHIKQSPVVSVMADESSDFENQKKLAIYVRIISPISFTPTTHFMANLKIPDGTAQTITNTMLELLEKRGVQMNKVFGFGSDGASVMTGHKAGVITRLSVFIAWHIGSI